VLRHWSIHASEPPVTRFATTQWSVILRGHDSQAQAREALEAICIQYRQPVLGYIREHGFSAADAEDLTQDFFARLLEQRWDIRADPQRGRFRTFVLSVLRHFLANEWASRGASKRGGKLTRVDFDDALQAVAANTTPEREFNRLWTLALVDGARRRLADEARSGGREALLEALSSFLMEAPDAHDYAEVAQRLGLKPNTVAVHVHRLRQRLRELIRDELADTVCDAESLDAEMEALRRVADMGIDG
jgi:RNA polymerase sigma-70 factor (ECF subfamily)